MKLWFITGENDDGENLDLFVLADTIPEAVELWEKHYEQNISPESKAYEILGDYETHHAGFDAPGVMRWEEIPWAPACK